MKRLRFFFRKLRFNKRKPFILGFLFLLCLGVTVGYAFLTTELKIDGALKVSKSSWDIHFENVQIKEGSVTATTPPNITNDTTIAFAATLENPGEFYEFTVDVVNDGTYDAKLDSIEITPTLTEQQQEYFNYIVEYSDGEEIQLNDALDAGTSKNIKIAVQYKENEDNSKYPGEDVELNFTVTMNYIQGKGNNPSSHQETIITFNSNGGVGTMANQTIPANTPTALTKNTYTRTGYLFNGWNTESNGTGTQYHDEEEVSDLGEITLYADWKVDQFPYVFRQDGECTFNGSSGNITGEKCSNYTNNKYIDTGIKLYSETNKNKDYEIGFTVEEYVPTNNVDQATLMNTKYESTGYPGLVFRKNGNTDFELASRKTSSANETYRFAASGVKDIRIYRINNEIYYKIDDGERTLLNNLTQYNPTFDLNVWFGAAPTNASATTAQRYFVGRMSNMYIRLGTYVDEGTYTITLNPNGGTVNPEFINVTEGSSIGTLPTPVKELHNFLGWYTNLTTGVEVTSSYIPDDSITIFAKWEKKPTYSITFEEDGGEAVEDREIEQGSSIGELPVTTKTGKSFDGWYLENTYTTKVTSSYVPTGNITLYAKWSNTTFPKVFEQTGACTFNGSSGTITGENCSNYVGQKYIDTGVSLYSEENKSKDYEIGFTIESYTPSNNENKATLMNTKLEATGYPGVVFRRNEATDNFVLQSRKTSSANEQLTFAYNTVTSVVVYRISNEIYYSINGGEKTLLNNLTQYNPTFNLTTWFGAAPSNEAGTSAQRYLTGTLSNMYIKLGTYEEVGKYRVTFNPNGGEELSPNYKLIEQGASLGLLPSPSEREWYTFEGWYTSLNDGIKVDENYVPTGNITLFAKWIEIPSYTITLNPNNGNSTESRRIVQGTAIGELPSLTREWYTFDGWYTGLTDGIEIDENFIPSNSMEIFARWSEFSGETTFVTGKEFNTVLKQLVSSSPSSITYESSNQNIQRIDRKSTPPTMAELERARVISTEDSSVPIYIWNGGSNSFPSIGYYTSASKIYCNEDSSFMFYNLEYLYDIDSLSEFDTSRVKNMSSMFDSVGSYWTQAYMVKNFQIDLTNWNTSNVTNMSYMFHDMGPGATTWSIGDLSNWDVTKVTNMSGMFYDAGRAATTFNLDLSNWNTSSVTDMSSMFRYVGENATTFNLNMSDWNTSSVTDMSSMFHSVGKNATTWSIGDLSGWDTSSVTDMSSMFRYAGYSATTWSIGDISGWNTLSVTNMSDMFHYAGYSATTWSIGDLSGWNTSSVTNMSDMFHYAGYSATTWSIGDISGWNTSSVTNMSSMFDYAGHSTTTWSIGDLSDWDVTKVTSMSGMFYSAGENATTFNLNLSNWNTSSVTNMSAMFNHAGYSATTWSIGDISGWNTSSVTYMSSMFNHAGYSATTWSIGDISGWNTSSVTNMSSMFDYAGHSTTTWSIGDLSDWDVTKVTSMSYMFYGAGENATTFNLNLSNWNTSSVTNMSYMFCNAGYSATTWSIGDISGWDTSSVTDMSNMFNHGGYSATTFNLNLSNWNTSNVTNMGSMFNHAGYSATVWSITIPTTNGAGISNTTSRMYGNTSSVYVTAYSSATGRAFTLATN